MKFTMQLTMDGMLRALRWQAHNIAENAKDLQPSRDRGRVEFDAHAKTSRDKET